jgi:hypothetical protein
MREVFMFHRTASCAAIALLCCGAASANPIKQIAGPVQQVQVVSDLPLATTSVQCVNGYANIPGAALNVAIPSGPSQLLVARFSGHVGASQTNPGPASTYLRIVVGTRELNPVGANTVASTTTGFQPPTAIERSGPVSAGTHIVRAQFCVNGDNTASAVVAGWHMTIEVAPLQ